MGWERHSSSRYLALAQLRMCTLSKNRVRKLLLSFYQRTWHENACLANKSVAQLERFHISLADISQKSGCHSKNQVSVGEQLCSRPYGIRRVMVRAIPTKNFLCYLHSLAIFTILFKNKLSIKYKMTIYSDSVQISFFKYGPILNHSHLNFTGSFNILFTKSQRR